MSQFWLLMKEHEVNVSRWLAGEFHTRLRLLIPIGSTLNPRLTSSALALMQG